MLFVRCCWLLVVRRFLFVNCWLVVLLFVVCCSMCFGFFVVRCSLCVVRCVFCVVCCLVF